MRAKYLKAVFAVAAVVVFLMLASVSTPAQCAMCKAVLENSTDAAEATRGMNLAAIVLLFPPVTLFSGLFYAIYRFRNVQGGSRSRGERRSDKADR